MPPALLAEGEPKCGPIDCWVVLTEPGEAKDNRVILRQRCDIEPKLFDIIPDPQGKDRCLLDL